MAPSPARVDGPARVVGPVWVVGDAMLDVVVVPAGPVAPGSDTPARIEDRPGGSGANVAAWLASAGAVVTFSGAVGDDSAGRLVADDLRRRGVVVDLQCIAGGRSGRTVTLVDPGGERTFLTDRGANDERSPIDGRALWGEATPRHLHVSGYTLLGPGSAGAAGAALDWARSEGIPTSVDASSTAPLAALGVPAWFRRSEGVGLCFANHAEAAVLAGTEDVDAALDVLLRHYPEVVVKAGADGAWWASASARCHCPPVLPTSPIVDTVGAGDAFAAGYLARRLAGDSPEDALAAGAALASRALQRSGGRPD